MMHGKPTIDSQHREDGRWINAEFEAMYPEEGDSRCRINGRTRHITSGTSNDASNHQSANDRDVPHKRRSEHLDHNDGGERQEPKTNEFWGTPRKRSRCSDVGTEGEESRLGS